jgi:hypothetical protein
MRKQVININNFISNFMKTLKSIIVGVLLIFMFLLSGSCTKKNADTASLYIPTSADITATATLTELQQGRDLYINNCGKCHGLYSPDTYSSTQWKSIMNSMAPKTGLTAAQALLVTKFVTRGN